METKTYVLKVTVDSKDPTDLDKNLLIEHLEKDLEETCNRDRKESRIRFVSLELQP